LPYSRMNRQGGRRMRREQQREHWRERINRQAESGQSIREWCDQNGVREGQYYAWKARLFPKAGKIVSGGAPAEQSAFIPLDIPMAGGLTISLGKDIRIELSGECGAEHLRVALEALRGGRRCWQ